MRASVILLLASSALAADLAPQAVERGRSSVELRTGDGAVLQGLRYGVPGPADPERPTRGEPVILLHGLAASLHQFDLDEKDSPALAQFLARKGWDVWLFNWRGAGQGELRSTLPDGRPRWCADEYITEDLPTILAHVRKTTGKRPFLVGHSLGGMTINAWLAGASKVDEKSLDRGVRVDSKLAKRRQSEVHGAVLLSTPARLTWPEQRRPEVLTYLAKMGRGPIRLILPARIPLSSLNRSRQDESEPDLLDKTGDKVKALLEAVFGSTDWARLAFGGNRDRVHAMLKKMHGGVLGDTSENLLMQLARGAREGTWPSYHGPAKKRVDYAEHYGNITLPVLSMVGREDRIAELSVIREHFHDRVSSPDKTFRIIEKLGHSDITLDDDAHREVFTPIEAWLAARSSAAKGARIGARKKAKEKGE